MKKPTSQPYLNRIGANIRDARLKAGLSQAQLYICRGFLSRIENGSRVLTDIEIEAIARVLQVTPNDLFRWDEP